MGCNCGKKGKPTAWVFTAPTGVIHTYGSEVEANAAKIRAGGGSVNPK